MGCPNNARRGQARKWIYGLTPRVSSNARFLVAGRGLILAPAAGVPALGHVRQIVGEGRLGGDAGQVELVAIGTHLDEGPAAASERELCRRRIVEGAEHVPAEIPFADRAPHAL